MAKVVYLEPISKGARLADTGRGLFDVAMRPLARRRGDVKWWPAMNGQKLRIATVRRLIGAYEPDVIVETGTFRGASTAFLASFSRPVFSAETSPRHHAVARARLWRTRSVTLALGKSTLLVEHLTSTEPAFVKPFFYLDAHWDSALPLREELDLIWSHWPTALVVVDDFRVPDDPGFGYDDYGEAGAIEEGYCALPDGVTICYPDHSAESETGFRRGTGYMGQGAPAEEALQESIAAGLLVISHDHRANSSL